MCQHLIAYTAYADTYASTRIPGIGTPVACCCGVPALADWLPVAGVALVRKVAAPSTKASNPNPSWDCGLWPSPGS